MTVNSLSPGFTNSCIQLAIPSANENLTMAISQGGYSPSSVETAMLK
jgi:hypothetical protein